MSINLPKILKSPKNYPKYLGIGFGMITEKLKKVLGIHLIVERLDAKQQSKFYAEFIGLDKLIFDIGANIGKKTEVFLQTGAKIVAVEPQANLVNNLRNKYRANSNVSIEQCGIGSKFGTAEIQISTKYPGFSSFTKDWQKGTKYDNFDKKETVGIKTMDWLVEKYGLPYFAKIDVEGFEYEVLSGLSHKIPILSFEFHSDDTLLLSQCVERLTKIGYTLANFAVSDEKEMRLEKWIAIKNICQNITESAGGKIIWGDIYVK